MDFSISGDIKRLYDEIIVLHDDLNKIDNKFSEIKSLNSEAIRDFYGELMTVNTKVSERIGEVKNRFATLTTKFNDFTARSSDSMMETHDVYLYLMDTYKTYFSDFTERMNAAAKVYEQQFRTSISTKKGWTFNFRNDPYTAHNVTIIPHAVVLNEKNKFLLVGDKICIVDNGGYVVFADYAKKTAEIIDLLSLGEFNTFMGTATHDFAQSAHYVHDVFNDPWSNFIYILFTQNHTSKENVRTHMYRVDKVNFDIEYVLTVNEEIVKAYAAPYDKYEMVNTFVDANNDTISFTMKDTESGRTYLFTLHKSEFPDSEEGRVYDQSLWPTTDGWGGYAELPVVKNETLQWNKTKTNQYVRKLSLGSIAGKLLKVKFKVTAELIDETAWTSVIPTYSIPGSYKPGWDIANHPNAIALSGWSNGYNSGVPTPTVGFHAHWVLENNYPVMYFNDSNYRYDLGHRWLGIAKTLGLPKNFAIGSDTVIKISWDQKVSNLEKGVAVGLYHNRKAENTYAFEANLRTLFSSKVNAWERISFTTTTTTNWDLEKDISVYVYGHYGDYGEAWVKNLQVEIVDFSAANTDPHKVQISAGVGGNLYDTVYVPHTLGQWQIHSRFIKSNYPYDSLWMTPENYTFAGPAKLHVKHVYVGDGLYSTKNFADSLTYEELPVHASAVVSYSSTHYMASDEVSNTVALIQKDTGAVDQVIQFAKEPFLVDDGDAIIRKLIKTNSAVFIVTEENFYKATNDFNTIVVDKRFTDLAIFANVSYSEYFNDIVVSNNNRAYYIADKIYITEIDGAQNTYFLQNYTFSKILKNDDRSELYLLARSKDSSLFSEKNGISVFTSIHKFSISEATSGVLVPQRIYDLPSRSPYDIANLVKTGERIYRSPKVTYYVPESLKYVRVVEEGKTPLVADLSVQTQMTSDDLKVYHSDSYVIMTYEKSNFVYLGRFLAGNFITNKKDFATSEYSLHAVIPNGADARFIVRKGNEFILYRTTTDFLADTNAVNLGTPPELVVSNVDDVVFTLIDEFVYAHSLKAKKIYVVPKITYPLAQGPVYKYVVDLAGIDSKRAAIALAPTSYKKAFDLFLVKDSKAVVSTIQVDNPLAFSEQDDYFGTMINYSNEITVPTIYTPNENLSDVPWYRIEAFPFSAKRNGYILTALPTNTTYFYTSDVSAKTPCDLRLETLDATLFQPMSQIVFTPDSRIAVSTRSALINEYLFAPFLEKSFASQRSWLISKVSDEFLSSERDSLLVLSQRANASSLNMYHHEANGVHDMLSYHPEHGYVFVTSAQLKHGSKKTRNGLPYTYALKKMQDGFDGTIAEIVGYRGTVETNDGLIAVAPQNDFTAFIKPAPLDYKKTQKTPIANGIDVNYTVVAIRPYVLRELRGNFREYYVGRFAAHELVGSTQVALDSNIASLSLPAVNPFTFIQKEGEFTSFYNAATFGYNPERDEFKRFDSKELKKKKLASQGFDFTKLDAYVQFLVGNGFDTKTHLVVVHPSTATTMKHYVLGTDIEKIIPHITLDMAGSHLLRTNYDKLLLQMNDYSLFQAYELIITPSLLNPRLVDALSVSTGQSFRSHGHISKMGDQTLQVLKSRYLDSRTVGIVPHLDGDAGKNFFVLNAPSDLIVFEESFALDGKPWGDSNVWAFIGRANEKYIVSGNYEVLDRIGTLTPDQRRKHFLLNKTNLNL